MKTRNMAELCLKECSHCKERGIISYACPKCRVRACMFCAIENDWKCPNCDVDVVLKQDS